MGARAGRRFKTERQAENELRPAPIAVVPRRSRRRCVRLDGGARHRQRLNFGNFASDLLHAKRGWGMAHYFAFAVISMGRPWLVTI
jgi:hypothetical protein